MTALFLFAIQIVVICHRVWIYHRDTDRNNLPEIDRHQNERQKERQNKARFAQRTRMKWFIMQQAHDAKYQKTYFGFTAD